MAQLNLKIVTPEKEVFNLPVDEIVIPSAEGELGILPHHINLMAKIIPGELKIKIGSKVEVLATGNGFIQVTDNVATILTDMAVEEKEIDEKMVEEAKKRAEQALQNKENLSDEEYATTLSSLERSLAQLKVKKRHKNR